MADIWQWKGNATHGAGYSQQMSIRDSGVLHRNAITAVDKCTAITITATANDTVSGSLTAVAHGVGVAPGNIYGSVGMSTLVTQTPTLDRCIDIVVPQSTDAEHYDICLSTATTAPLWVARITEAQRATGCRISAVATVTATTAAGTVTVGVVGTGQASTSINFAQNNAFNLAAITETDCIGKETAIISVEVTLTDLRTAPTLKILPFFQNTLASTKWHHGELRTVELLTGPGQGLFQTFELPVKGATGLKLPISTLTGQGAAVTIWVDLV